MPSSMTGFARIEAEISSPDTSGDSSSWGTFNWEIRSVNHRFLECHFRLPEQLRELEPKLREALRRQLQRGKLEIALHLHMEGVRADQIGINHDMVNQLISALEQIEDQLPNPAAINAIDLLKWPGVIQKQDLDRDQLLQQTLQQFDAAVEQLIEHRQREGAELSLLIEQRLTAIAQHVKDIRSAMPKILQAQRDKLTAKLDNLHIELDPERLEQEVVLVAQKADVDEELDRLDTHVAEVRRTLKQSGSIGRRLDFLMQELNREANTLSSKSIVSETTLAAVELKVLIEQMREQIQNIE